MPRGEHPNSRANLTKAYGGKGGFDTESARRAKEKSDQVKAINKSLTADLREQATPERMAKINNRLLSMAEHGNLKAYELLRDGLGEKPKERIDISARDADIQVMDGILEQLGMTDEQP